MKTFNTHLTEVKNAYAEGKLIPFIGSGFSKPLDLPDWRQLVAGVAASIGFDTELFFLHGSYPQLLDYIRKEHPNQWKDFIHELHVGLDSPQSNKKRTGSTTHQLLAELNFLTIYTTNYDPHIEKAIIDKGKKPLVLTRLEDFACASATGYDCEIIKFHGDVKEDDTMILTETQYFNRMALEEAVDQRLRADLLSNSFLFVGYSFNDANIRYIWYKINKLKKEPSRRGDFALRKSYYITFANEPIQARLLEAWDVEVIALDPENPSDSLTEFLKALNAR